MIVELLVKMTDEEYQLYKDLLDGKFVRKDEVQKISINEFLEQKGYTKVNQERIFEISINKNTIFMTYVNIRTNDTIVWKVMED